MPRPRSTPSYRKHKPTGQAVVTLADGLGNRHDVYLGPYGSKESRLDYARVIGEWEANGRCLPAIKAGTNDLTINELILKFWPHVERHYRLPDGTPTREVEDYRWTLRIRKEVYGSTPACEFGPLALKAVRQRMLEQPVTRRVKVKDPDTSKVKWQQKVLRVGLSRGVINQRIGRIRRMFKWAVENELVPPSILHGLQAVRGLQRGRSEARETDPVRPISEDLVMQTLPYVLPPVAALIQLQLLTGMRPGEATIMRAADIDMTGEVWLYRPALHKTMHHGHERVIAIGPKGQEIIRPFLKLDTQAYLFSPKDAVEAQRAEKRKQRKTKVQPSQVNRKKRKPKRQPGDRYTPCQYSQAVRRACKRAGLPHWHPHQLRHTAATKLRREYGLDVARVVLGHRTPAITELYAELDTARAQEAMEKLG